MTRLAAPAGEAAARQAVSAIWEQFKGDLDRRVTVLERAVPALVGGTLDAEARKRAHMEAHKLTGALGTLGLPSGSDMARELERWLEGSGTATPTEVLRVSEAVEELRRIVDAGPRTGPPTRHPASPLLLVVDSEPADLDDLRVEAKARGIDVDAAATPGAALDLLRTVRPDAALLDLFAGDAADDPFEVLQALNRCTPAVPTVVLTRTGMFADRVEAARLGGRGFLQRPVAPSQVLDVVAGVIEQARGPQATVMVVDDDPVVTAAVGALLEADGLRVVGLNDALEFWTALEESSADLLVLDVDMPGVDGVELCQVVRSDPRWAQLPILVLTAWNDAATVQRVFGAGADDYVAKPVVGPELTTRIANRLDRTRLLQHLTDTDALTGLPNRSRWVRDMDRLAGMAVRYRQPLSVAVIHVDGLEALNHGHGHALGDEVLGRLGQLLVDSFEGDDVVGRLGGAELFVGLYGMTRGDGVQRVAEALEAFRAHRFDGGGGSVQVSFTAGVAQYPGDGAGLEPLYRTAGAALHRARAAGGNRVVPAGWEPVDDPGDRTVDVLVVDDDEALAAALLHSLATRGYRARWVADGREAVAALEGPEPRLVARVVLLDLLLPGLDGLEVLGRLGRSGGLDGARVIMLTARHREADVLQAMELGAFDHLAKPFSVRALVKRIHRAMES